VALYPVYEKILKWCRGRENLASFLTVILTFVLILIPSIIIGILLFKEAVNLYASLIDSTGNGVVLQIFNDIQERIRILVPGITIDLQQYVQNILGWLVGNLNSIFSSFMTIFLDLFLIIFALFYLFKNGDYVLKVLRDISPLDDVYDNKIFQQVSFAINSIVRGSLMVSLIQGFLIGLGFYIFGVPNPVLWGLVTCLASFVPIVGTALVSIPAIIYLVIVGHIWPAVALAIWSSTLVHLTDNVALPFLIKKNINLNPLLIVLSILGGLSFFGPVGFLVGPIILSVLFILFDIYPLIFKKKENN
jgi:predicted PurR-regulated permease PerM